jgi:glycosyltransferase involved in cell wall biosynthesis
LSILQNGTLQMSEEKKIKVLVISDHPMAPSGVGSQTKYVIDALIRTGRYKFICFGGAMKHTKYEPQSITGEEWDDGDWVVYPVDGYGTAEMIRSVIWTEKPDILWFMTDPRFFGWLWQIENEIRGNMPMVYYHVWDNLPYPRYNKKWYDSNDVVASISKVTYDVVNNVSPDVENHYIPHAVDANIFKKYPDEEISELRLENLGEDGKDKVVFLWNNRNARRKQSGTLALWFSEFAEEVGPDNVRLIMHTDSKDQHGQDLHTVLQDHGFTDGRVVLSEQKVPPDHLAAMYNIADCTINISDAEGFGLATLESLSCGTPIVVTMTGGLQEQVTDGEEWFGIGLEPSSKAIIGSQQVPYIYEDRINKEDFKAALHKIYNMSKEEREELGRKGTEHVRKNYNFKDFNKKWIELMDSIHERYGSWGTRKGYKAWEMKEIA